MSFENWLKAGWVRKRETSPQEIADLLAVADRDLVDCQSHDLSSDWRLNIAYNSALQSATAALAAAGYRPSRESHHYRVIQSLALSIGADSNLIGTLDQFRKKRNIGGYEKAGLVTDQEANEMVDLARQLHEQVKQWIETNHPHLMSKYAGN